MLSNRKPTLTKSVVLVLGQCDSPPQFTLDDELRNTYGNETVTTFSDREAAVQFLASPKVDEMAIGAVICVSDDRSAALIETCFALVPYARHIVALDSSSVVSRREQVADHDILRLDRAGEDRFPFDIIAAVSGPQGRCNPVRRFH